MHIPKKAYNRKWFWNDAFQQLPQQGIFKQGNLANWSVVRRVYNTDPLSKIAGAS